jgi:hypothetical protein
MAEALDAFVEHGGIATAARALGIPEGTFRSRLDRAREWRASQGHAPGHFDSGVAPGFTIGKVTVQRGPDGAVERTWERQSPDKERALAALREAVEAMAGDISPASPVKAPYVTTDSLLTLYTFTDYHVGALCWHKEGGADWDTAIAEQIGVKAMQALVDGSPPAHSAIVNVQGDFLHWDGLQAVTPTHGHVLDADSRFGKVVDVAIRLIRQLVATALAKHEQVILLICEGNHDIASSLWLRKLFAALYENEPRVTVHDSELPYYAIRWGNVMLGFHHGHMKANGQLPALFAAQFREMWGQCHKVAIHTGHRHHREVKEHPGAEVIQHPTLAARDAYAARGGWWSERRMSALTYHKSFGEVGSSTVCPEMLEA